MKPTRLRLADVPPFTLTNRTGYDTRDLARFFARGLAATHTRARDGKPLRIVTVPSPIRSRGCAEVGKKPCSGPSCDTSQNGSKMAIAVAGPHKASLRRLAHLLVHECAHIRGYDHKDMDRDTLLSLGATPAWARGTKIRYYGSAPPQLPFLRKA